MTDNSKLPKTPLQRGGVATATAAKVGGKKLSFLAKKPFLKGEKLENLTSRHNEDIGEALFKGLSKLRGTALKIAQLLSLEMNILPPELQKKLAQSHYQVPPLNRALVRRVVEQEFGKPIGEIFQTFDLEAFAAASLGQVHRATLPDGTEVAVKVQYPGIADTIESDLKLVKHMLMPLLSSKMPKDLLMRSLEDVWARLREETNYRLEAKRCLRFNADNKISNLRIPKPFEDFTTEKVLTTEFIQGLHMTEYFATKPTQDDINKACQAISDFHATSFFENCVLHCDPNPGNYLFLPDGEVAVIDFGAVKEYEPEVVQNFARVHDCVRGQDVDGAFANLSELGMLIPNKTEIEEIFWPVLKLAVYPCTYDSFDYKKHPNFIADYTEAMRKPLNAGKAIDGFISDKVHLDRNDFGLHRIFAYLGAEVRFLQTQSYKIAHKVANKVAK